MVESGESLVAGLMATANTLLRESRRLFRPLGLTEAQFNVLNLLGAAPRGMSQRELSERLVVDRSNVTVLLDRMEAREWVRRDPEPGDRRAHRVVLTAEGRRLWSRALPRYRRAVERVVASFSEKERKRLAADLARLAASAKEWSDGPV